MHGMHVDLRRACVAAMIGLAWLCGAGCQGPPRTVEGPPIVTAEGILFGPTRTSSGEAFTIRTLTYAQGEVVQNDAFGKTLVSPVSVERRRLLERRTRRIVDGVEREVEFLVREDRTRDVLLGTGRSDASREGSLVGRRLRATLGPDGLWSFEPVGRRLEAEEQAELGALVAYENRRWFPDHRVQVGDEWPIKASYVGFLLRQEVRAPKIEATARLEEVQRGSARLSLSVRGEGQRRGRGAELTYARIELKGSLWVDLDTLLDRRLELSGSLEVGEVDGRTGSRARLPMRIFVEKVRIAG